jgi:hypothetical protein
MNRRQTSEDKNKLQIQRKILIHAEELSSPGLQYSAKESCVSVGECGMFA